jgi:hypothetical protein
MALFHRRAAADRVLVLDPAGLRIGRLEGVSLDADGEAWAHVRHGRPGARRSAEVPLRGARLDDAGLTVVVSRARVLSAPEVPAVAPLADRDVLRLQRHYASEAHGGLPDGGARSRHPTG